jgi:hypothetical protein
MQSSRKSLEVHEYEGTFQGRPAHFKMTSVIGHVLSIDFPPAFQSWETTDPATLFAAPTIQSEANPKANKSYLSFPATPNQITSGLSSRVVLCLRCNFSSCIENGLCSGAAGILRELPLDLFIGLLTVHICFF